MLVTRSSDDEWGDVVDLYGPRLRRAIVRRTADRNLVDDVLQETFARAWRARRSGADRGVPDAGWLRAVAARASVDVYRRQPPPSEELDSAGLVGEWLTADRAAAPGSDEHVDALVWREAVRWAFRQLAPRQRRLLYLRGVCNLTYQEIARREGTSEVAVGSALNRARERLRVNLGRYRDGPAGGPAAVVAGYGLFARARARLARIQSSIGPCMIELMATTTAIGAAVAMAVAPSAAGEARLAAAHGWGAAEPAVSALSSEPTPAAVRTPRAAGVSPSPRPAPGVGPQEGGGSEPVRTATQLDIGADEMTFRLDVVIDVPGIDDGGTARVEVYCTRSVLLSRACPTLDSVEPKS